MKKMKNIIVLENVRSAYNVWNIIRTAEVLGYDAVILWYTPSPLTHPKVQKTSLWAEKLINIVEFIDLEQWYQHIKNSWYKLICMEVDTKSVNITQSKHKWQAVALVMWNEVDWVDRKTLECADEITLIPLVWTKESLNVSQAAAIGMWEFIR